MLTKRYYDSSIHLTKQELFFVKAIKRWLRHPNRLKADGREWIYHTYEQWSKELSVSKITVIRTVRSLEEKGVIERAYLSKNKRNRTSYYSLNEDVLKEYTMEKNTHKNTSQRKGTKRPHQVTNRECNNAQPITSSDNINDNINDNMYNNNNIYKSIKSINHMQFKNISISVSFDGAGCTAEAHKKRVQKATRRATKQDREEEVMENTNENEVEVRQKPTIVQDMIKIWYEEFPGLAFHLTQRLARFLVAAFKTKFESCLKTWRRYLRLLKTSEFIMKPGFKLDIWWVIKYLTIDRIMGGWFGVNPDRIPADETETSLKAAVHFEEKAKQEEPEAMELRRTLEKKLTTITYLRWFDEVRIEKQEEQMLLHVPNSFFKDFINPMLEKALTVEEFRRIKVLVCPQPKEEKEPSVHSEIVNDSKLSSILSGLLQKSRYTPKTNYGSISQPAQGVVAIENYEDGFKTY